MIILIRPLHNYHPYLTHHAVNLSKLITISLTNRPSLFIGKIQITFKEITNYLYKCKYEGNNALLYINVSGNFSLFIKLNHTGNIMFQMCGSII